MATNMGEGRRRQIVLAIALILACVVGALLATVRDAKAIPAWSRKYNADCTMCHYPVIPRLNSFGQQFRRAGYRTADEFNKDQDVTKVGDFLAFRARARFGYDDREGRVARSETTLNDVTFWYAGAITKHWSAFVEPEMRSDGTLDLEIGTLQGVFGTADRFFSIRVGQGAPLQKWGFGGFDRPTGISTNPVHDATLTRAGAISGANFKINTEQKGLEVAYVQGRSRLLASVWNGVNTTGSGRGSRIDVDPQKDYLVAYEHILDDIASGFTLFYYKGTHHTIATGATSTTPPTALGNRFDFTRFGVNANKIFPVGFGFLELQGGVVRSYDNVQGTVGPDVPGIAFYVESQQVLKDTWLTFYERYALIEQDTARKNTRRQDYTIGATMPVETWLRVAAEYTYTDNRAETVPGTTLTGASNHSTLLELQVNW